MPVSLHPRIRLPWKFTSRLEKRFAKIEDNLSIKNERLRVFWEDQPQCTERLPRRSQKSFLACPIRLVCCGANDDEGRCQSQSRAWSMARGSSGSKRWLQ